MRHETVYLSYTLNGAFKNGLGNVFFLKFNYCIKQNEPKYNEDRFISPDQLMLRKHNLWYKLRRKLL